MVIKTITRKFKKFHYRRDIKIRSHHPYIAEISLFLNIMFSKGYAVLNNSITIRDISNPDDIPNYRIWGWFVYLGKKRVETNCIIYQGKKKKTKLPDVDDKFTCVALGKENILSDEGKAFKFSECFTKELLDACFVQSFPFDKDRWVYEEKERLLF